MGRYAKNRELRSASYSIRLPVGSSALGPNDPVYGLIRYNTTNSRMELYDRGKWRPVNTAGNIEYPVKDTFFGDSNQRSFGPMRFSYPAGNEIFILVYVGNVFQNPGVAYVVDGYNIIFTSAPPTGHAIVILHGIVPGDYTELIPASYRPALIAADYTEFNEVFTATPGTITSGNSVVFNITGGVPNTPYLVTNEANANVSVGTLSNIGSANFSVTLSTVGVPVFTANFDATDNIRTRSVIVNDPSILSITANYTPTVEGWVAEGSGIKWDVVTDGSYNGQFLYFSVHGTVQNTTVPYDLNAFSGGWLVSGSTTSTSNITVVADLLTEGTETMFIRLRTGSSSGPIIATSDTVTIKDTSVPAPWNPANYAYRINRSPTGSINEGTSVNFEFFTTDTGNESYYISVIPNLLPMSVYTLTTGDFIVANTTIGGITYSRSALWASFNSNSVVANTAITVSVSKLGTVVASNSITIINSV
jgi:hypothetical protein